MDEMKGVERLSRQQRRCLLLVGKGQTAAQIAYELGIAEGTVNGHIVAGMAKLGVATRRQAGYLVVAAENATHQIHTGINYRVGNAADTDQLSRPSSVREIDAEANTAPRAELPDGGQRHTRPTAPLRTVALIVGLVAGLLVVILALKPLIESARDLANVIQPARPH